MLLKHGEIQVVTRFRSNRWWCGPGLLTLVAVVVAGCATTEQPRVHPAGYIDTLGPDDELVLDEFLWEGVLADMREQPQRYLGRIVSLEGFVYRSEAYGPDEFTVGRLKIDCCIDDAGMIGVRVMSFGAENLEPGSWVRVRGKVEVMDIYDQWLERDVTVPVLIAGAVEPIDEPDNAYLCPVDL